MKDPNESPPSKVKTFRYRGPSTRVTPAHKWSTDTFEKGDFVHGKQSKKQLNLDGAWSIKRNVTVGAPMPRYSMNPSDHIGVSQSSHNFYSRHNILGSNQLQCNNSSPSSANGSFHQNSWNRSRVGNISDDGAKGGILEGPAGDTFQLAKNKWMPQSQEDSVKEGNVF